MTHFSHSNSVMKIISDTDFSKIIRSSKTQKEVARKLGHKSNSFSHIKMRIKKLHLDISHFTRPPPRNAKSLKEILQKNVDYSSTDLKKRLIKEGILKYECVKCNNIGYYNDLPCVLQLDHINGDHYDNRLNNLAIHCPNCHWQTDTHGVKNTSYVDDLYVEKSDETSILLNNLGIGKLKFNNNFTRILTPLANILQQGTCYSSNYLKKRLVEEGYLKYICINCNNDGIWMGKPLVLQLDHINGDHFDNRITNLSIKCPTCHSQTKTFGRKNRAYEDGNSKYIDKHNLVTKEEHIEKQENAKTKCVGCNEFTKWKTSRCKKCHEKFISSKSNKPPLHILEKDFNDLKNYRAIGKKYGVSDNAIRKWFKTYEVDPPRIYKKR